MQKKKEKMNDSIPRQEEEEEKEDSANIVAETPSPLPLPMKGELAVDGQKGETTSSIVAALSSAAAAAAAAVEPVNNCNIDNNDFLTFFISFASVAGKRAA